MKVVGVVNNSHITPLLWANWKNYVLETQDKSDIEVIVLLTSWGTGSSAVAGFLDKCGCYTCPPHFMETKDPKTPNTYEPSVYRGILSSTIDEATFQQKSPMTIFSRKFSKFLDLERSKALENKKQAIVLKHPLQSFLLPEIEMIASPKYLILTRPYDLLKKQEGGAGGRRNMATKAQKSYMKRFSRLRKISIKMLR